MKIFKLSFILIFCISIFFVSCKKDPSGNKVGIDEGKIKLSDSDTTITFTIIDIKTQIMGDTTTLIMESVNKDSTIYFFLGFEKIANFIEADYLITDLNIETPTRVYAYIRKGHGSSLEKNNFSSGKVEILQYLQKSQIQGKFELKLEEDMDTTIINGEFFASYPLLDPNRLPNLPISPQTMEVSVNSVRTLLNAHGSAIDIEGEKGYLINGTVGNDQSVAISFKYFVPKVNQVYKTGEMIVIENDPTLKNDNDTGFVEASYFEKGITYMADSKRGEGTFTVTKLSSSTIQGTFSFIAVNQKDTSKKMKLDEGMFFTKIKTYN